MMVKAVNNLQRRDVLRACMAAAVIIGNRFQGPAHISNQIGAKAKIGMNAVD